MLLFQPFFLTLFSPFLFSLRNYIFPPLPSSWTFFVQLIMIRNLSFSPTLLESADCQSSGKFTRDCCSLCADYSSITPPNTPNHSSNASTDSQRKQRLPPISWFKCCPNWLVFLHISRALSPLLGGLPISLYLLIIDSACKLGTKTSKQSQQSLCRLEGVTNRAGVNVKLHYLNLTKRPPFLDIYVRLFKAAARSSATTTGFTVVHH